MFDDFLQVATGLLGILFLLAILVPAIFFLLTLQKTLSVIHFENRRMQSGHVWLLLIPLFNFVWIFFVVNRLSDSIKYECARLNIGTEETRPTYGIGISMCVLVVCRIIPVIGALAAIPAVVCWIIYWVKVNKYKNLIIANKDSFMFDFEKESAPTDR